MKNLFFKRKILNIQEFAHAHKDYLVIVADPKDDTIFVSYKNKQITGRISSADGKHREVVKKVLKGSTFESAIDRFIGGLVDIFKTKIEQAGEFYKFLDGALFNIGEALSSAPEAKRLRHNKLMNSIILGRDVARFNKNKSKFTKEEQQLITERLNLVPTGTVASTASVTK